MVCTICKLMRSWNEVVRDPARLAALRRTSLVDTPPERCLDQLMQLAAEKLQVHAAFVSLIDEHVSFYKSCFGFGEPLQTTRRLQGETLCHYALIADGVLIIDDARADLRYANVPTVRTLGVVAYLGIPLHSVDGYALGAFALIDAKPRCWSREDIATAFLVARAALREIELRIRVEELPAAPPTTLSTRERQVMLRLVAGQRLKEIAGELGVTVPTVATHRQRLLRKLGLDDNRSLFRYALRNGLLDWTSESD
jgi:DNA-binding CsgD family transcriptional regulator